MGIAMGIAMGITMWLQWDCNRDCNGIAMGMQWDCNGDCNGSQYKIDDLIITIKGGRDWDAEQGTSFGLQSQGGDMAQEKSNVWQCNKAGGGSTFCLKQCSFIYPTLRWRAATSPTSPSSPLLRKSRFANQNGKTLALMTLLLFSARRPLPRSAKSLLARVLSRTQSSSATPPL